MTMAHKLSVRPSLGGSRPTTRKRSRAPREPRQALRRLAAGDQARDRRLTARTNRSAQARAAGAALSSILRPLDKILRPSSTKIGHPVSLIKVGGGARFCGDRTAYHVVHCALWRKNPRARHSHNLIHT